MADKAGWCRKTARASTGQIHRNIHHILLFQLIQWYMMLLWHFPAFESTPMSTRLYTEWMIPPKCILEFCTNTFSELSKQCRPLSRCIVYAFCTSWLSKWVREWQRERRKDKEGARRERKRERESLPLQKTSALQTAQADFPFCQHFSLRAEQIAKGTT